jgi:hypothetical protein
MLEKSESDHHLGYGGYSCCERRVMESADFWVDRTMCTCVAMLLLISHAFVCLSNIDEKECAEWSKIQDAVFL